MPVTIKTNVDVEGKPTPNGLPAFANLIAPAHAPIVSNLKKAGAIIIGKTNLNEFGWSRPSELDLNRPPWSPWNSNHMSVGSSSGSGAAT